MNVTGHLTGGVAYVLLLDLKRITRLGKGVGWERLH
jgi:hypothetical protein